MHANLTKHAWNITFFAGNINKSTCREGGRIECAETACTDHQSNNNGTNGPEYFGAEHDSHRIRPIDLLHGQY